MAPHTSLIFTFCVTFWSVKEMGCVIFHGLRRGNEGSEGNVILIAAPASTGPVNLGVF